MEKIKDFLRIDPGSGYGDGSGSGYGSGSGHGSGHGDGYGSGSGSGSGSSSGYGSGSGHGSGYGNGYGSGSGYGYGDGDGVSMFDGNTVYQIDGVATIIKSVRGNIAKGFILNDDLTLTPCYIAKGHNKFAHGETIKQAVEDLQNKIFEDMDAETAIELFFEGICRPFQKVPRKGVLCLAQPFDRFL